MTGRTPVAAADSMIGVVGKQNIVEMPSRFRISVIASMTFIFFLPGKNLECAASRVTAAMPREGSKTPRGAAARGARRIVGFICR
jgi:hypothetical protein